MLSKKRLKELILEVIPYPDQIIDWDLKTKKYGVRFTWRETRFQVLSDQFGFIRVHIITEDGYGEESNNTSILLEGALKLGYKMAIVCKCVSNIQSILL